MTKRLSPRLKPAELESICLDIEQWDLLEQVADHPSAWPELQDWIDHALSVGPDLAGEPPEPPAGWKRGDNKRPPKYLKTTKPQALAEPAAAPPPAAEPSDIKQTGEPDSPIREIAAVPASSASDPETDGTEDDAFDEIPRRTLNGWTRTLLAPVLILAVLFAGGGTAIAVHMIQSDRQQAVAEQARKDDEARRSLANATKRANMLLGKVKKSPVSDDRKVKRSRETLSASMTDTTKDDEDKADGIAKATDSLNTIWTAVMRSKASEVGASLSDLIATADGLKKAPDTDARTEMLELADEWRDSPVTAANLTTAIEAERRLTQLCDEVGKAKAKADDEARKKTTTEAGNDEQEASAPSQSSPSQSYSYSPPQSYSSAPSTSPSQSGGSAPSWSVSPDKTAGGFTGLPGSDGSL
nr:hypothetical protein [Bifidobacterium miconisargentati]